MVLTKSEWNKFAGMIEKADNSELQRMIELTEHELHLSDVCIEDEKRK